MAQADWWGRSRCDCQSSQREDYYPVVAFDNLRVADCQSAIRQAASLRYERFNSSTIALSAFNTF
jgi:hypothetical protein